MHNREAITPRLLWQSMKDYDLWLVHSEINTPPIMSNETQRPIYFIGLTFEIPVTPVKQYMTLTLRGLGFDTFVTNLLNVPHSIFHMFNMLVLTYSAEAYGQISFIAMIGQLWAMPFLLYLVNTDLSDKNKWAAWAFLTLLLAFPNRTYIVSNRARMPR